MYFIEFLQVGGSVSVPNVQGTYPYCRIYAEDGCVDKIQNLLICCDEGHVFKIEAHELNILSIWKVLLVMLSVYYCFNTRYPAFYGLLEFIDRMCVDENNRDAQSVCFNEFVKSFSGFVNAA